MVIVCVCCVLFFCFFFFVVFFFFQAEDGIRVLVRSRGLGDVYKRQVSVPVWVTEAEGFSTSEPVSDLLITSGSMTDLLPVFASDSSPIKICELGRTVKKNCPVSYTHLTLPTIYSV